jgi:hypothetical protein
MSYQAQAQLEGDAWFQQRNRAVCVQQADTFRNDQRPDYVAVAEGVLRDDSGLWTCFNRLAAAGPGIADKADDGAGGVDQELVTDADLLSLTQAHWPEVATLYFQEDGTPIGGA